MSRGETLKSAPACLFGRFPTPGCRSVTGNGLGKPKPKRTIMTIEKATLPPPPDRARSIPISALTPEQIAALTDLKKLKQEAAAEVERLIAFLDMVDGYSLSECEDGGDDEPSLGFQEGDIHVGRGCQYVVSTDDREADDGEDEPSLAALEDHPSIPETRRKGTRRDYSGDQSNWARGASNDCEVEDEHDEDTFDREDDPADGPELVNEDGDGNPDDEPSLGWTNQMAQGQGAWGDASDREAGGSYVTEAARKRYKPLSRWGAPNRDGKHVDSERGFGTASRRLRNLSDPQRAAVSPRLNRDEVRI